jgi:hypothetical protein
MSDTVTELRCSALAAEYLDQAERCANEAFRLARMREVTAQERCREAPHEWQARHLEDDAREALERKLGFPRRRERSP